MERKSNSMPKVDVIIPTYNHGKYIREAIESALNQITSFNYRIIIGDDFSTDNTLKICKEFYQIHKERILLLSNEKNLGLVKNYQRLFSACSAEYIAILEGDDYWTDPLKLSKQIYILDNDTDIGLVHTRSFTLYEDNQRKVNYHLKPPANQGYNLYLDILKGEYPIVPLTVCFRKELIEKFIDFDFCLKNDFNTIDAFFWPEIAIHKRIHFIDEITGCYRYLSGSISNNNDFMRFLKWEKTKTLIIDYYNNKYPVPKNVYKEIIGNNSRFFVSKGLALRQFGFVRKYLPSLPLKNFSDIVLYSVGKFPRLYFLFIFQQKLIQALSKIKQIIIKGFKI